MTGRSEATSPSTQQAAHWTRRLALSWLAVVAPLALIAAVSLLGYRSGNISTSFLWKDDVGLLLLVSALYFPLILLPSMHRDERRTRQVAAFVDRYGFSLCIFAALAFGLTAFAGWYLIYQSYPLSMDEFQATFGASLFRRGEILVEVAPQWRRYAPALAPLFTWTTATSGHQYWAAGYLPVNAAFRAAFGELGSEALAGPFWMAGSIVTVYAIARQLWPERRDVAFVCAALLATSSQVLFNAMSPYAMPAHLALNLAWLWLFLRKSPLCDGLAMIVAFAATGLHELAWHPLFAAPFVLELWVARRWSRATLFTAAYAAIAVFWMSYQALVLYAHGVMPVTAAAHGSGGYVKHVLAMLSAFHAAAIGTTAENLLRFAAWQNPLAVALAVSAAPAALRTGPVIRPMLIGILLTTVAATLYLPFQGHGWGYRHLHGHIGDLCLLAGFAWARWVKPVQPSDAGRAWAALGASCAVSMLLSLPIRAYQVFDFIHPYAQAHRAILASSADVVILDPTRTTYGIDLVRNDPFLEQRVKVMNLENLTPVQIRTLCARYKVALFDSRDGERFGIQTIKTVGPAVRDTNQALLNSLTCGGHVSDSP